jgi:hypothetical protein
MARVWSWREMPKRLKRSISISLRSIMKPSDPFSFRTMTPSAMSLHAVFMAAPSESEFTIRQVSGFLFDEAGGFGAEKFIGHGYPLLE